MKTKDIIRLGVPFGKPMDEAVISAFCSAGGAKENLEAEISAIVAAPDQFADDPLRGPLAAALRAPDLYMSGKAPAPWSQWGTDIDEMALKQSVETVMAAQTDLVEVLAQFDPRLVKMCPSGERPED